MKFNAQILKKLWRSKWAFGGVAAFLAVLFSLFLGAVYDQLELKSYNLRFAVRGEQSVRQDGIVVVAIDDQSIASLRTWPFPRTYFARALLNLRAAGARMIIVDVEFTEASKKNPRADLLLAAAVKRAGNVILAGEVVNAGDRSRNIQNTFVQPPLKLLTEGAGSAWGIINVDEDADGFVRRYLLFQLHNRRPYLSISLRAFLKLRYGTSGLSGLNVDDNGDFVARSQRIPKIDFNSMLINYRGPAGTFPTYSFEEVLDDKNFDLGPDEDSDAFEIHKRAGTFRDKIVYIGASAEVLHDNKLTPFFSYQGVERKLPGVEVHASALSTLLRGDFIYRQGFLSSFLVVLLLAAVTMVVTKLLKPFRGLFAMLALMLLYIVISFYLFIQQNLWVDLVTPMFAIGLSYLGNMVHQTLTEQRERVRIKKSWEQYMSRDVIDSMLDGGELPKFGGERRELTVLFSDIRSFTTYTERHTSHAVVTKLSEYLTEMVDVIFKHAGTLDKFVGDEIMAIYGAPYALKDHALKACHTAIEMIDRLCVLQKRWSAMKEDYFEIGIGINSGKVILGNLGSSQLFDYTVIGDDVNLGARLEGANKQYGTTIIISEFTQKLVQREARVRELDLVRVKGKKKPVRIFELRSMEPLPAIEQDLIIDVYSEGLRYYKEMKWYQAMREFKRVLNYFPTDGPTRLYIKRCLDFTENPPQETWDGVYDFTSK